MRLADPRSASFQPATSSERSGNFIRSTTSPTGSRCDFGVAEHLPHGEALVLLSRDHLLDRVVEAELPRRAAPQS